MLISMVSCATSSPSQVKTTTHQPQRSPRVTLQLQWWQLFSSPVFNSSDCIHSWDKQDVIFCLMIVSGEAVLCSSYALDEILFSAFPIPVFWCFIRGFSCGRAGVLVVAQPHGGACWKNTVSLGSLVFLPQVLYHFRQSLLVSLSWNSFSLDFSLLNRSGF